MIGKNIILIGFMGTGKSSVGKRLAKKMNYNFIDTDAYIEELEGKKISDIFNEKGEEYFRKLETKVVKDLSHKLEGYIVATGGGLPLRRANQKPLRNMGTVIYLKSSENTIYQRLKYDTTRPLLQGDNPKEKIHKILKQREPIYRRVCHRYIKTDNRSFEQIVEEIEGYINEITSNQRTKH